MVNVFVRRHWVTRVFFICFAHGLTSRIIECGVDSGALHVRRKRLLVGSLVPPLRKRKPSGSKQSCRQWPSRCKSSITFSDNCLTEAKQKWPHFTKRDFGACGFHGTRTVTVAQWKRMEADKTVFHGARAYFPG